MAAIDRANASNNITAPAEFYAAVTPSDTAGSGDLVYVSRAIYVGTGGDMIAVTMADVEVTFTSVPDGTVLPIRAKRIKATGTTATNIVSLA
jgi:hypothetical protein